MSVKHVAIELYPGHVNVVVLAKGMVLAGRRTELPEESDPIKWVKMIRAAAPTLCPLIEELNAQGASATVFYRSPSQAVDLQDFQLRSASLAIEAATLAFTESLPYSLDAAVCEAEVIGRDKQSKEAQSHVVVAADRIDVADAIVHFVEKAGLKFNCAMPLDTAIMAGLASSMLDDSDRQHGLLYIGRHSSFFLVAGEGSLNFGRSIRLGLENLTASLIRPIRTSPGEELVELSSAQARTILREHGLQPDDKKLRTAFGFGKAQFMPLVQPVLQRYIVELRQSLRFGLTEEQRGEVSITLAGPGSSVGGLANLLGEELNLDVSADPAYESWNDEMVGGPGSELVDALKAQKIVEQINLMPPKVKFERRTRRWRRWMMTGAAAAIAMVGFDGWRYAERQTQLQVQADALETKAAQIESLEMTKTNLMAAMNALNGLRNNIRQHTGAIVNYRAIFQEISKLTPAGVELTGMNLHREEVGAVGTISGYAAVPDQTSQSTVLQDFIQRLATSPLFNQVILDSVQTGVVAGQPKQRFEATLNAIAIPVSEPEQELTAVQPGESP